MSINSFEVFLHFYEKFLVVKISLNWWFTIILMLQVWHLQVTTWFSLHDLDIQARQLFQYSTEAPSNWHQHNRMIRQHIIRLHIISFRWRQVKKIKAIVAWQKSPRPHYCNFWSRISNERYTEGTFTDYLLYLWWITIIQFV